MTDGEYKALSAVLADIIDSIELLKNELVDETAEGLERLALAQGRLEGVLWTPDEDE